jgi:cytochrome c biogenesis protein CcmG/thiol:disulfide interchange protein DsbE
MGKRNQRKINKEGVVSLKMNSLSRWLLDQRHWALVMLVIFLAGSGWTLASRLPPNSTSGGQPPPSPRVGFSAPDFTLDLLSGGQVTLSGMQGKVVVINFWTTWCPPCKAEMPALEKVYRAFKDLGLEVLAVNSTNQDDEADMVTFVQELDLSFPVPLDLTGAVSAMYNLQGLPSTYFIDGDGVISDVVVGGPMSEALIQSKVEDLLKENR